MLSALLATTLLMVRLEQTRADEQMPQLGEVRVELHWPDGVDTDVDLWVRCPGDVSVGYSNKIGGACTLDRDDLGATNDRTPFNYETARSRGIPAGEYVV